MSSIKEKELQLKNVLIKNIEENPFQQRKKIGDKIPLLANSLKNFGILQPILIRKTKRNKFQLISGQRRFLAAKYLKWKKIPALVGEFTYEEMAQISLLENIQREKLTSLDEGETLDLITQVFSLIDVKKLKDIFGMEKENIKGSLSLTNLSLVPKKALQLNLINEKQAEEVNKIKNKKIQICLIKEFLKNKKSLNFLKGKVKILTGKDKIQDMEIFFLYLEDLILQIKQMGIDVSFKQKNNKNSITFSIKISKCH
jgi:ParB family chromosome partitioning protein